MNLPTLPAAHTRGAFQAAGAFVLAACALAASADAQDNMMGSGAHGSGTPARAQTRTDINKIRAQVNFEQKLGATIPLELEFLDENGARVKLRDYFHGKPVLLTPVYYGCPMLCTQVLNGLARALRAMSVEPGKDFEIVSFSINPKEEPALAAEKKAKYLRMLDREGAENGWHFLSPLAPAADAPLAESGEVSGPGLDAIRALTESVGFRYYYDPDTTQYAHQPGFVVLTPEGKVSRYVFGLDYDARDLTFDLIESSNGKVGGLVARIQMLCFEYDPASGTWGFVLMNVLRLVGALFIVLLGGFIFLQLRRDRRAARLQTGGA